MKKLKILTFTLACNMLITSPMIVCAQESVESCSEYAFDSSELSLPTKQIIVNPNFGKKAPTGTSFVDIKKNVYTFDVTSFTVDLFTNSFFKKSSKVKVTVNPISVEKNGSANKSKGITVHLRKKGSSSVNVTHSASLSGESFYYENLDASALYYLEFTKENDKQIYSFDGTIENAE